MKTPEQIVDEALTGPSCCDVCDSTREKLVAAVDEALAMARADERVKATADAYEKVSRTVGPRGDAS
jgi:hypothetical protein